VSLVYVQIWRTRVSAILNSEILHYQKTYIYNGADFVQRLAYIAGGKILKDKGCLVVAALNKSLRKSFP
jgi:hypothetical protein